MAPHYYNAEVDRLLAAAQAEGDPGKRRALYARFQQIVQIDLPKIPLVDITQFALSRGLSAYAVGRLWRDGQFRRCLPGEHMTLHISNVEKVAVERPFNGFVRPFIRARRHGYRTFLIRRISQSAVLFFLTILLTFTLINAAPGDMVGRDGRGIRGGADAGYVDMLRGKYGLDKPLPVRLYNYVNQIAHLDLGYSFPQSANVTDLIADRVGPTLLLMARRWRLPCWGRCCWERLPPGMSIAPPTGLFRCWRCSPMPRRSSGRLMLILLFSVKLGWFPLQRHGNPVLRLYRPEAGCGYCLAPVLPAVTLSLFHLALFTRLLRASLLEVLRQDFVRTARAKGVGEWRVLGVHALGNALLPLVTMVGMQIGAALGGAVVVESVFAWPGLGRLAFEALSARGHQPAGRHRAVQRTGRHQRQPAGGSALRLAGSAHRECLT